MLFWIILTILILVIFVTNQHYFSYWSNRNVPHKNPIFFLGDLAGMLSLKKGMGEYFARIYEKNKNKRIFGLYFSYRPTLLICDPLLIQDVLIKDFPSFHDRGFPINEEVDPLGGHLFVLSGQRWRDLRVKLSPTFTGGKLKGMYSTIFTCAHVLQEYIEKGVQNGNDIFDIHDLMGRFTTNVISSVAFGIENDCINDPEDVFRKMGVKFIQPTLKIMIINILTVFVPKLLTLLKIKIVPHDIEEFFMSVVQQTIEQREKNQDFEKKDFMQMLIQLKNQGYVSADKDDDQNNTESTSADKKHETRKLTLHEVASQAFLFFAAGFETSSSTSNFCLLELSKNPEVQKKAQDEIDEIMSASNSSEITYDMLGKMKFLECCIDETLRKYPIVPVHIRECTKDYTFSDSNWNIEKGTTVFIPVQGLHRDPNIYENPMEFRPERFMDSASGNGNSNGVYYMPFGDGPRNCIGARMGKLQTKLGLAMILSKFSFEPVDKHLMNSEIEMHPNQFILTPKETILLKASSR